MSDGTTGRERRIGAYGVCHDAAGRLLMVRASARTAVPGWWQIPGGGVRQGEDPAAAVVREFAEETGLTARIVDLVAVSADVGPDPGSGRLRHTDRIVYRIAVDDAPLRAESAGGTDQVACLPDEQLRKVPVLPWCARLLDLPQRDLPALAAAMRPAAGDPDVRRRRHQRFGAYGVVTDPAGRLLLTRTAPGYPGAGRWHLPGGGTDFGEQPADGLVREIVEETGQDGRVGALLAVRHHHDPAALGPEGHPVDWHVVQVLYRVRVDRPSAARVTEAAGGSTGAAGWFTPVEATTLPLTVLAGEAVRGLAADDGR
ncbi:MULTISPECIES: NUDIX hydrolase [unclassified Solwaraspora]|uniref:NUDIX hydrolase n=1 Tax=unclassified Solwaraspora TaxID=2627926 RepID=UPI00259B1307|nr:NUDIX hydrolase [Solwaraspora sp. WMMA2056]WJK42379.1 NUDIX hydrolase [Solwaraspora sp. WMMA2056]